MPNTATIAELLRDARERLAALPEAEPALEAELLLAEALEKGRTYLLTWPDRAPEADQAARFDKVLQRRLTGEPIAYILGRREFWSLELEVSPAVLIPRVDTELLVELALGMIPAGVEWRIADLGTGSGAIAAAIASERPQAWLVATDRSPEALEVARRNLAQLGLTNIETRLGRWFDAFAEGERLDLLLSNPPYIPETDPHLAQGDLPHEPRSALASGPDGLDDIRHLIAGAPAHLRPGGQLLLEHGWDQGEAVRSLFVGQGWERVETWRDLGGRERVSGASWGGWE